MRSALTKKSINGFGLVEILAALVVVVIGLLAVANLQTNLISQSNDNKAKAEALALAQQRLEDIRNYTGFEDETAFNTEYADTNGYANSISLNGVNAEFTRAESIATAASGDTKEVAVRVSWTDRLGESQSVVLTSNIAWQEPRTAGDMAKQLSEPLIPSATGRAYLGEGELPEGASTTPNGDGTELYDDGSGDLKLVVGNQIVLTLVNACQAQGSCTDFVRINGRVYIDTATQNNLDPGDVYVKASDAAYCHRYYTDAGGTVHDVEASTTSARSTANNDYEYFDYTCYLGGGWHGNIGILLNGGIAQSDKICMGDATIYDTSTEPDTVGTVIAARRAYRGMIYKVDGSGDPITDANGDKIWYSVGIGDAVELPPTLPSGTLKVTSDNYWDYFQTMTVYGLDTDGEAVKETVSLNGTGSVAFASSFKRVHKAELSSGAYGTVTLYQDTDSNGRDADGGEDVLTIESGTVKLIEAHDFVISSLSASQTAGDNCINAGVMRRTDAVIDGEAGARFAGNADDFFCLNPNYIDALDSGYEASSNCPYDPTDGPATRHVVSGTIYVTGSSSDKSMIDMITVDTSDGDGNCSDLNFPELGSEFGTYTSNYTCDVYEWTNGWTGYVKVSENTADVLCDPDSISKSAIGADDSGNNFTCYAGKVVVIAGTLNTDHHNNLIGAAIITDDSGTRSCDVAADGLSYECTSNIFDTTDWTGSIQFTKTGGNWCAPATLNPDAGAMNFYSDGYAEFSGLPSDIYTLDVQLDKNSCSTYPPSRP